jgi:hypothetical protein
MFILTYIHNQYTFKHKCRNVFTWWNIWGNCSVTGYCDRNLKLSQHFILANVFLFSLYETWLCADKERYTRQTETYEISRQADNCITERGKKHLSIRIRKTFALLVRTSRLIHCSKFPSFRAWLLTSITFRMLPLLWLHTKVMPGNRIFSNSSILITTTMVLTSDTATTSPLITFE